MTSPCSELAREVTGRYRRALEAARGGDLELVADLLDQIEEATQPAALADADPAILASLQAAQCELVDALLEARESAADELTDLRRGQRVLRRLRGG